MGKAEKLRQKLLDGRFTNFAFSDADLLLKSLGFIHARTTGSHHFYKHPSISEPVNIQAKNGQCKPYQLHQIRRIVEEHDL